jgi:hypothetical protein
MSPGSRFLWRGTLPIAFMVVALASAWSWWVQPETTRIGFAPIPGGARSSVTLSNQDAPAPHNEPCAAWRLHLRIDRSLKPPGPAWIMFEGTKPGEGYELHWLPARPSLLLVRANQPLVLGAISLDHCPEEVVLIRHGFQLEVWVDDRQVLYAVDPQAPAPTMERSTSWGFQAAGPMDDSSISLHDDRHLLAPETARALKSDVATLRTLAAERQLSDHAVIATRYALALDPEKSPEEMATALRAASVAVQGYGSRDRDGAKLRHWLAWGEVRLALARQDLDATLRAAAAVEQLAVLGEQVPETEAVGLAMELLDRIARAGAQPPQRAPEDALRWRHAWLGILADAATSVEQRCPPAVGEDWRWQLRLLVHGANCLRGRPPLPTPAEAPDWAACRWRAFAGGNPRGTAFSSDIPVAAEERNPIRPALERLIQLAAFEPGGVAAVTMRANILDALDAPVPQNATAEAQSEAINANRQRALEAARSPSAPAREAVLAVALLALHGIGEAKSALAELDPDPEHASTVPDGATPLARRDPLAYALYRLIQHRLGESRLPGGNPLDKPEKLPEALGWQYGRLLSGRPEATHEAWLSNPAVLPPAQALASALAMQEVLGTTASKPNWSLLEQIPCFTLPLRLIRPAGALPSDGGTGKPPVVP